MFVHYLAGADFVRRGHPFLDAFLSHPICPIPDVSFQHYNEHRQRMMQKYTVHTAISLKINAMCVSALIKKTSSNKQGSKFSVYAKMKIAMKRS